MDMPICCGKKIKVVSLILSLFYCALSCASNNTALINVKIGLMESLSPTAPSSSDRYKKFYESALYYAIGENEQKLQRCGYKLSSLQTYFGTFDGLDLIKSSKQIQAADTWLVIGPRRSSDLITATTILNDVPMVSTMANSDDIYQHSKLVYSMYASASHLAKLMVHEIIKQDYGRTYGTLVDARCRSCVEFAKSFQAHNQDDTQLFYIEVADNNPDINELLGYIQKYKIDYLVTPNYSGLTGYVISEIQKHDTTIKYIGTDGWGEDTFSFLQGYPISNKTTGMSIRVGANKHDKAKQYQVYSLDKEINGTTFTPPYSIYALITAIRILTDDLCDSKALNKEAFKEYLTLKPRNHFQLDDLYSIYNLKDGGLVFSHYLEVP